MEFALQETLAAAEVKRIRKKLKLKQRELASLMGVSVKTVEYWESRQGTAKGAAAALLCILRAPGNVGGTADSRKGTAAPAQIYV